MLYHFYLLSSFYFLVSVEVVLDAELSLYLFSPHFYKITVKNICLWWECLKQICTFFSFFKLTMKHQERTHVWDNVYSQQKSQNHREDQTNVFKSFFPAHQHLVTVFFMHWHTQWNLSGSGWLICRPNITAPCVFATGEITCVKHSCDEERRTSDQ